MGDFRNHATLDAHCATSSYIEGCTPTQKDVAVFQAIAKPGPKFPHAARWYKHMASFSAFKMSNLPGIVEQLASTKEAKGVSSEPTKEKKEKPAKEPKEPKAPKEKAPKEEKKEEKKDDTAAVDKKAAEKLLKTVIKEGGKKGVEIEGASDMGGLDFFCTTIESPEGDQPLLLTAMKAMNAQPDEGEEERKGCSGHVGKMIFSAGNKQLAIVAYVPKPESNKSASKVDITKWIETVCAAVGGKVTRAKADADSPHGGHVAEAVVLSDPEKGKFAIKDKDAAMAAAFAFLREKGAFPEDDGDDSDEMVFGDDDNLDDWE